MTSITYFTRRGEIATDLTIDDYRVTGEAHPTARLLAGDIEDDWADQEWVEDGVIGGQKCRAYYLFDADESAVENPENLPWDEKHIARIIIEE